jgi:Tfp pilus assembly protein PilO
VNKKVVAIAVAASLALMGIWYVVLFSPQSKSVHKANAAVAAANAQAATLRSQVAVLQKEKTQLPATTSKLATLQLALPDTPALDKLVDDVNGAANDTGVDWQTVSPSKPASYAAGSAQAVASGFPGGMQALTVTMQVNGTSKQITDFVTRLTGMSRLLDVTSLNLSGVGGAAKATGQITTQIFYVPPPAGSVPTSTPTTVTP